MKRIWRVSNAQEILVGRPLGNSREAKGTTPELQEHIVAGDIERTNIYSMNRLDKNLQGKGYKTETYENKSNLLVDSLLVTCEVLRV